MPLSTPWRNDLYATSLLLLLIDVFGADEKQAMTVCQWDPETIRLSLAEIGVTLSPAAMSRLLVAMDIVTSNRFRQRAETFIEYCNVLSGSILGSGIFDPADLSEVAWGITEAMLLSPPDDNEEEPYCPDIVGYVERVIDDNGLMATPPILHISPTMVRRQVPGDFSSDATLFSAIYAAEGQKMQDLTDLLKDRTRVLLNQIKDLPLKHGQPKVALDLLQRL